MNLLKFIPIKLTLFLILGILTGKTFNLSILTASIFTISLLFILAFLFYKRTSRKSISFGICTVLTMVSIGILAVSLWQPKNHKDHYSHFKNGQANAFEIKVREVLKTTAYSQRYIGEVQKMNGRTTSGKVLLSMPKDSLQTPFKVDHQLLIYGRLAKIKPPLNPHQFDYQKYMEGLGIYHQLRLSKNNFSQSKFYTSTIYGIAASIRTKIISKLREAHFPEEELSIVQALLLGERNDISEDTYDNYKNAGAVHILAVSGLHIGILLLLLQFILRPLEFLPKGKEIKLAFIVLILWGFALLAGFSASVVRAVTMFSFVAYALYLNRPNNTFNILALSMFFILLLINPMLLFQAGFQMSYTAVLAIVWIYPMLQKLWFPKNIILKKIWQLFSVSVAAQLGVLPISLFYFHQFPGLFFISNLLIVPFLGLILSIGIVVIALALANTLPDLLVIGYSKMIQLMNSTIAWVAQQEAFIFKNISFDGFQLVLTYALIIGLLVGLTKVTFRRVVFFLSALLLLQLYTYHARYTSSKCQQLVLLHQIKNSILLHKNGAILNVYSNNQNPTERLVTDYQVAERISKIYYDSLQNSYSLSKKKIHIIDSLGILPTANDVDYLILTQSPKINLERLLDSVQPALLIADGSNFKSHIYRWRKTCLKRKLPFHYTGEKGAFYFNHTRNYKK